MKFELSPQELGVNCINALSRLQLATCLTAKQAEWRYITQQTIHACSKHAADYEVSQLLQTKQLKSLDKSYLAPSIKSNPYEPDVVYTAVFA